MYVLKLNSVPNIETTLTKADQFRWNGNSNSRDSEYQDSTLIFNLQILAYIELLLEGK